MLNGAAICWASHKIRAVAISSFESEWYSASICGCEITSVCRILEEIGFQQTELTTLYEDNMLCIFSSQNDKGLHNRSKHIDVRIYRLRQQVEDGELVLAKIHTAVQVADPFTKPLEQAKVEMSRDVTSGAKPLAHRGHVI